METRASTLTNADVSRSFFVFASDSAGRIRRVLLPADVQIGRKNSPAALQLSGRVSVNIHDIVAGNANAGTVSVNDNDTIASVSLDPVATVTQLTVMLPSTPIDGQLHFVKDATGTANTTPIIVSASVGTIDGSNAVTITAAHGAVGVVWSASAYDWLIISDGTSVNTGSGGDLNASYVTLGTSTILNAERVLTAGSNISIVDGGAGGPVTISATALSGSGDPSASYVVLSTTSSLNSERVLTAGTGISIVDGGAGAPVTISAYASSSLPMMVHLPILAGTQTSEEVVFQAVSAFEFNPTGAESIAPAGSTTYTAYFQPIVEVYPTGVTLETQLYNVTTNAYVAASLLSCSALTATRLKSQNLSGSLAAGSNTYEMHMRITNARAGKAHCKGAKLLVTWQ